jgi:hypothetical protein
MTGGPLEGQQAMLWVDKDRQHVVDFVSPVPNSPDWHDLRLKLIGVNQMSAPEWSAFKARETLSYFQRELAGSTDSPPPDARGL